MKPWARIVIVVWCAFGVVPYVITLVSALLGGASLPFFYTPGALLAAAAGYGAYFQRPWTRRLLIVIAVWSALVALAMTLGTGVGVMALMSLFTKTDPLDAQLTSAFRLMVSSLWVGVAVAVAMVAIAKDRRASADVPLSPRTPRSDAVIAVGVALSVAFTLFGSRLIGKTPLLDNTAQQRASEQPSVELTSVQGVRIRLTPEQTARLSADNQRTVDELNADLALVVAGSPPAHATRLVDKDDSSQFRATRYDILARHGTAGIRQLDVSFEDPELNRIVKVRTFVIR